MNLIAMIVSLMLATTEPSIPPDITVAADGSANFKTVHEAVQSIPKENRDRVVILIKDGVYKEKVRIDAPFVTLRGQSRDGTRIEFAQLNEDFNKNPDDRGRAVVNLNANDVVMQTLTIANTAGVVGPHAFAIYGSNCDRTVIVDCDVLSDGADTISLWKGGSGRYYHARCNIRGAVDFVCPRGWCYVTDCTFYETKNTAAIWHDGSKDKDQKFVLRHCKFDGVEGWNLARHHHDAAFYLLDCTFSKSMIDKPPFRVIYPLGGATTTESDTKRNQDLDKTNIWGERAFFHNSHREGGDYAWMKDNLGEAPGSPAPKQVTAKWTFAGTWDPERTQGPILKKLQAKDGVILATFSEPVSVKGKLRWKLRDDRGFAEYSSGSGTDTLSFTLPPSDPVGELKELDLNGGAIISNEASVSLRVAEP